MGPENTLEGNSEVVTGIGKGSELGGKMRSELITLERLVETLVTIRNTMHALIHINHLDVVVSESKCNSESYT